MDGWMDGWMGGVAGWLQPFRPLATHVAPHSKVHTFCRLRFTPRTRYTHRLPRMHLPHAQACKRQPPLNPGPDQIPTPYSMPCLHTVVPHLRECVADREPQLVVACLPPVDGDDVVADVRQLVDRRVEFKLVDLYILWRVRLVLGRLQATHEPSEARSPMGRVESARVEGVPHTPACLGDVPHLLA
eukprot:327421-Chlamydomonas_euryale.AAC.1